MKRLVGLALVLVAIALAVVLGRAVRERRAFAEQWALSVFADLGVGPVRLEVTDFGPRGARVRGLEIGDPVTFSVEQLDFVWRPSEIARFEISELVVSGLHLDASLDENGEFSWGALDPAFEGEGDGSRIALTRTVTLVDGRVEITSPFGGVSLRDFAGTLVPDPESLGTGALQATLRDSANPERFAPVELDLRAEGSDPARLAIELTARLLNGAVAVSGTGTADLESRSGEIELALARVRFGPDAVRLAALAPAFAAQLPAARGSVSGNLRLRRVEGGNEPYFVAGSVHLDDLDLERSDARLEGLTGRLEMAGPAPWHTLGVQELEFDLLDLVGAISDAHVRFESRGTDVHLESFRGSWAGGEVVTRGRFDPMNQTGGLTVQLADIDLERLLETLDIDDLDGTGRISGAVPIVFEGESLRVGAALAADTAGGVIHWKPAAGAAGRLGLTGDLAVVADALEDYHYEELQVGLEGDLAGDVRMRLSLKGNNPAYEGGRPVHLDLRVESNVPATLLASRATSRMPEALERRLRERARR